MALRVPEVHAWPAELVEQARKGYAQWWAYYADPQEGFTRFLDECVYTSDEEARTDLGEEAKKKFPIGKSYVYHLIKYGILQQRLLVLPKSRRMTATWIVAAYCVWFAMFKQKRNVLWQAQNGSKSADTLRNKMLFIMENLPTDRIAPFVEVGGNKNFIPAGWDSRVVNFWVGKRDAAGLVGITFIRMETQETGQDRYVEDSRIIGIAEGQDQWRQYTVSLGVLDEFAFFTNARDSIKGARPAVGMNGQLIFISSAAPGYMKDMIEPPDDIQKKRLGDQWRRTNLPAHRGVDTWVSAQGYFVYRLHYTADDGKNNPEWTMWPGEDPTNPLAGRARQGYDARQWNQEMEIDFSVHDGEPFYPEYSDTYHRKSLLALPDQPIILGFDFGLTPATVICQISPTGHLLVLDELVSTDAGIVQHGEDLIAFLNDKYKWWRPKKRKAPRSPSDFLAIDGEVLSSGPPITSYVDPAGVVRAQTDMRSPVDIMREMGLNPMPSIQDPVLRSESVRRGLREFHPYKDTMLPRMLIDPNCKILLESLRGGAKVGKTKFHKEKNEFSHITEALEYVTVQLFKPIGKGRIDTMGKKPIGQMPYVQKRFSVK